MKDEKAHQEAMAYAAALQELASMPDHAADVRRWAQVSLIRSTEPVTVELMGRFDDVDSLLEIYGEV